MTNFRQFFFLFFGWIKNPYLEYNSYETLIIRKAPAPSDCVWVNMDYSMNREILNNTVMIMVSILILFLSFKL